MTQRSRAASHHAPRWCPVWCVLVLSGCSAGTVLGANTDSDPDNSREVTADAGEGAASGGEGAADDRDTPTLPEPGDDGAGPGVGDDGLDAGLDVGLDAGFDDDGATVPGPDVVAPEEPAPVDMGGPGGEDVPGNTRLVHPGVLNSRAELEFIRARVAAKQEPWLGAFKALQGSRYATDNYQATPFSVVACGSYNQPNEGCNQIVEDGMAVYARALLWSITREQRHADKALQIIDAWARKYQKNTESNARLVVAWAAPWYVNGAEILRNSGAGWSEAAIARFTGMLQKMLPYVKENTRPENNWIQSRIEAHMAIAVFMDDPDELKQAVARFRFWLPIYIYQKSDGNAPINAPGRSTAQTYSVWKSTASQTSFVDGLAMETCRDLGHLGLGVGSMMYAAETAYQQGIDLFTPNKKRFSDFLELHGSWTTGTVKVPTNICGGVVKARQADSAGIKPPQGGGSKAWEIAYSHLHDRLGMTLPFIQQMISEERPTGGSKWVSKWETLTHAGRPLP